MPQGLIPEELSFAFLKTLSIAGNVPRFAAARARHEEGRKELRATALRIYSGSDCAVSELENSCEACRKFFAGEWGFT